MKHHKGLGGSAYVYLLKSSDSASVRKTLSGLNDVDGEKISPDARENNCPTITGAMALLMKPRYPCSPIMPKMHRQPAISIGTTS